MEIQCRCYPIQWYHYHYCFYDDHVTMTTKSIYCFIYYLKSPRVKSPNLYPSFLLRPSFSLPLAITLREKSPKRYPCDCCCDCCCCGDGVEC
mmetsp:Transcript_1966/g.3128  ORF Transcript_1966/g.3128 Transcript_1966/m.3128 type:complete len:92 (-) Transcript_1966:777-1052(-)